MGKVASSILTALDCGRICDSCSKYVFNAMTLDSKCSDCCTFHLETREVEVSDNDSEISLEVEDCCTYRRKT